MGANSVTRKLCTAVFLLLAAVNLHAQAVDAKVCDILAHPKDYDGKIVRITGTVSVGFDEFVIKDTDCKQQVNAIWLNYPAGTKAKAGPVALISLQLAKNSPGQPAPISATPVKLDAGGDFKKLDAILSAPAKIKGLCLGCVRSTATATLTGRLDGVDTASLEKTGSMFTGVKGFGNLAKYRARLVIQSVANVTENEIDYSRPAELGPASPDLGLSPDNLKRASAAYGAPGDDNGVEMSFGGANALPPDDGAKGHGNSPDGLLLNVVLDGDRLKGNAMSEAIAHTGTHIADLRESPASQTMYQLEGRAWGITVLSAIVNKEKTLTLPGGYLAWNHDWSQADQQKQLPGSIDGFLTHWDALTK